MTAPVASSALSWRAETTRKAIHLTATLVPIAWGLDLVTVGVVRGALAAAVGIALIVELVRRRSPTARAAFVRGVGPLLRPHEAGALTGATWLAAAMLTSVLVLPPRAALVAMWAVAAGDASAALVGGAARAARADGVPRKTLVGSLACAVVTAVGAWWLVHATFPVAIALGLVAAAAERPRLAIDDNVRVALATGAAAWALLAR